MMSITDVNLNADYTTLLADRAPIYAAVTADASALQAGLKTIAADVKASPNAAQDAPLLATVDRDATRFLASLRASAVDLIHRTVSLSKTARAVGLVYLMKPTPLRLRKLTADTDALNSDVSLHLTAISTDAPQTTLQADLAALSAADPTTTALAADVATLLAGINPQPFQSAGQTFLAAATTLGTDLQSAASPTNGTLPVSHKAGPYGSTLILYGTNFTGPLSVTFAGGVLAQGTFTDTEITVTVPFDAQTGLITVSTPAGTFTTGVSFTVTAGSPVDDTPPVNGSGV